jgi:hypothetical protein
MVELECWSASEIAALDADPARLSDEDLLYSATAPSNGLRAALEAAPAAVWATTKQSEPVPSAPALCSVETLHSTDVKR